MTGVVNRVSIWLTSRPPTMAIPSGWRSSEPVPRAQHQRQAAEHGRHGGHHDRAEAQQAGLADGLLRLQPVLALGVRWRSRPS